MQAAQNKSIEDVLSYLALYPDVFKLKSEVAQTEIGSDNILT